MGSLSLSVWVLASGNSLAPASTQAAVGGDLKQGSSAIIAAVSVA